MSESESYQSRMKKVQAAHREKQQELRDPDKGLVLVNTGNGKGKSSSAFGVAIRALGWKQRVGVVQFVKGTWITGERQFFERLGGVDWYMMGEGFTWDTQDRGRDRRAAEAALAKAAEMLASGDYDLVIMDEINISLRYEQITPQAVIDALEARDARTGAILTGRDAPVEICDYADLVSVIDEVKHPYAAGIKAQRGVDF
ncbi:cob(I)yrinic acid a,c-diamide adenosyltransferase [Lutimaribacter sp. EGI FJ00015]|uniref:Cob(I)yrinic acid a,c-diamide adenosyltransferase n=1 Tax=Lutimaribacter degradans TaxID=2945989 RepID=A0ACC5ZY53_9RHOB|nr:cob(I)yrinic acid a,c-diamide adenosyltransferase [Lutimaribacter sp. EGI FJ00013]MCM2562848.1 cob(I)yrinic acid a,c-diamide adenosyltransferase [Lutimaribacter sp. EGI FJ00013]MCO0614005.1 cob(I)yrinic acid a,c-diamide adenosyltransferase [Lutimaribacter sp. EGI FJ00015]MCO0636977.1 cob(I)yrinic acid a,c-diamide adenosyltransferase [Lutimaribacter sp. EGI FJ00014]